MSLSTVWTTLYLLWFAGEIFIAIATRTRRSDAKLQDRGTQIILWVVIFTALSLSGWLHAILRPDMPGGPWLRPISLALLILGIAIRAIAIFTLGRSFTANVATHAAQTLQRSGLYSIVRHPSYLGMEIIFFAIGIHSRNWAALAAAFIPPTLAVLYRIQVEETALRGLFGDEYVAYSRTTKRLFPGIY
jgi:protein-S-isoprenylcysteine O-methyltransferase Ste14